MELKSCAKCGGEMELGYLLDLSHGQVVRQRWTPAPLPRGWLGGIRFKGWDEGYIVGTYRCSQCGFLESYATREEGRQP